MAANKFLIFQQQNQRQNEKYKRKLKLLKQTIKNLLYENAALCDQVAQIQENILCVKEERRFLLKKMIEFENEGTFGGNALTPGNHSGTFNDMSSTPIKKSVIKKRSNSEANSESSFKSKTGSVSSMKMKANKHISVKKQQQQEQQQQQQHQVIQTITLPIELTGFVLHAIGDVVCDRLGYHAENCIYPVGYIITRVYSHIKDPEQKCTYTCQIIDNGDSPRFEIIPEEDSEYIISGPSPDYCHTTLLQLIHSATDTRNTNIRPQGEWFFGLTDPTVINLILNNPNAQNCVNFKGFCAEVIEQNEHNSNVNFEALQKHLTIAAYHTVPEIKEEPPDELLDHSDSNNFNVC